MAVLLHGLRGLGRRLVKRLAPAEAVILMYHRIAEGAAPDPYHLCVSPRHFAEHLEVLSAGGRRVGTVVPLGRLVEALRRRQFPSGPRVVLTFDDGYRDNLTQAKPLLERYECPATVFVTSGQVGNPHPFWWDELAQAVLENGSLPPSLVLMDNHQGVSPVFAWSRDNRPEAEAKLALYRELHRLLNPLRPAQRRELLDRIWDGIGGERPVATDGSQVPRVVGPQELRELAAGDLVEIGSHTVTHPDLTALPAEQQAEELGKSKAQLESLLGRPVSSLSYPHSRYTAQTREAAREAGFACACAYGRATVTRRSLLFALPRVQVHDWDGRELADRLSHCWENGNWRQ